MRNVVGDAAAVVGRERPTFARGIGRWHRFWSMNHRVIQRDAASYPPKLRDDPETHSAGALPTPIQTETFRQRCTKVQRNATSRSDTYHAFYLAARGRVPGGKRP